MEEDVSWFQLNRAQSGPGAYSRIKKRILILVYILRKENGVTTRVLDALGFQIVHGTRTGQEAKILRIPSLGCPLC
jgi:hypothetical protein